MDFGALLSSHPMLTTLIAWVAGSALGYLSSVLLFTRWKKSALVPQLTELSQTHLARIEADQAELFSTLEKLTTTVKRLSSRAGMQDVRSRERTTSSGPVGRMNKAEVLRELGMAGKQGPEFYRAQQQIEANRPRDH